MNRSNTTMLIDDHGQSRIDVPDFAFVPGEVGLLPKVRPLGRHRSYQQEKGRRLLRQASLWGVLSLIFMLALAACASPQETLPAGVLAGSVTAEATEGADLEAPLVWQGYSTFGDGDAETCKSLRMSADGQVAIVPCDSSAEVLIFPGQADLDSPAWQRAIESWVEFTYGEQTTGQRGAASRTVMSWWLGELPDQPGACRHLLVLVYGYAYANVDPCEGGQVLSTNEGWLKTEELEPFDGWLYNRAPLFLDKHYFEGRGQQEMSEAEIAAMAQWAEAVYGRLAPEQAAKVASLGEQTALLWEGYTAMGSADGTETCMQLALTAGGEATFGPCDETGETAELLPIQAQTWAAMQMRFVPFALETPTMQLLFQGTGAVAGPAWQRALASWAEFTFAELSTGHAGAATRTAMSWWLGEVPGQPDACAHLVVLAHGYAYADITPCAGGEPLSHEEDWLTTPEMEAFDAWLSSRAPVYQDDNYLDGHGEQKMSEAEIEEVAQWARQVYTRLQTGNAP